MLNFEQNDTHFLMNDTRDTLGYIRCVGATYDVYINLPTMFGIYMGSFYDIEVAKTALMKKATKINDDIFVQGR